MVKKNKTKKNQSDLEENIFSRNGIKNYDKIKLQEFYGSVFGQNKDQVKKSSQRLRFKIYRFGFIILIIALLFYFFIFGKINFVIS